MFIFKTIKDGIKNKIKNICNEAGYIFKIGKHITSSAYECKNFIYTGVANYATSGEIVCDVLGIISINYGVGLLFDPNYKSWGVGLTFVGHIVIPTLSNVYSGIHDRCILYPAQQFSNNLEVKEMRHFLHGKPDSNLISAGSKQTIDFASISERFKSSYFKTFFQSGKFSTKIVLDIILLGVFGSYYTVLPSLLQSIVSLATSLINTKKLAKNGTEYQDVLKQCYAFVHDAINRRTDAKLFCKTKQEIENLKKICLAKLDKAEKNKARCIANLKIFQGLSSFVGSLRSGLVMFCLNYFGALPTNKVIFVAYLMSKLNSDIIFMEDIYIKWALDYKGFRRSIEYFEEPEDDPNADRLQVQTFEQFTGQSKKNGYWENGKEKNVAIEFDHVVLKINGKTILDDVSLTVNQGELWFILGETGTGKTSIFHLLLRVYEPTSGTIKINGINVKHFKKELLWQIVSLVPQNLGLINDSIPNNIKYGNEYASPAQIEEAENRACFPKELHNLYKEKKIGFNGGSLSGGEQQGLAIARSYVRCLLPSVSILAWDELTTRFDPVTERKLLTNLVAFLQKIRITSLIITPSLRSVNLLKNAANQIIVLFQGKIIEKGTFDELMKKPNGWLKEQMSSDLTLSSGRANYKLPKVSNNSNSIFYNPTVINNSNKDILKETKGTSKNSENVKNPMNYKLEKVSNNSNSIFYNSIVINNSNKKPLKETKTDKNSENVKNSNNQSEVVVINVEG